MNHIIHVNGLNKEEAKDIKRVMKSLGGAPNVKDVRNLVSPGKALMITYMILTFIVLAAIGVIFLPFLLIAFISPFIVWYKVLSSRSRWLALLPIEKDAATVKLV